MEKKKSWLNNFKNVNSAIRFLSTSSQAASVFVVILGFLCGALLIRIVGRNPAGMYKSFFQVLTGIFWNNKGQMRWEIRYIGEWLNCFRAVYFMRTDDGFRRAHGTF